MLYIAITLSALVAVILFNLYIKKKQLHLSKFSILVEATAFWIVSFGIFYLKSFVNSGYRPAQNMTITNFITAVITGVFLAGLSILAHTFYHDAGNEKYKPKRLFTIRGSQLFPLLSLKYFFAGILVVFAALFVVEAALKNPVNEKWAEEDMKIWNMDKDKNYENKTDYPLIKVKGTSLETDGDVKILVLGDSFVFGYGYSNFNYMWWNQLSNVLRTKGYNNNVYGVGYEGASTYSELQWLTKTPMVADLDPDIIIIGYVTNDPESTDKREDITPQYGTMAQVLDLPFENTITKLLPNTFSIFDNKLSEKLGPLGLFRDKIGYQYSTWELKQIEGEKLEQYNSQVIQPLGEYQKESGVPIILFTTPHVPYISYFEPRYKPVLPLFELAGIKTYNMLYDYSSVCSAEKYKDNLSINPVDPHPGTTDTWFYSNYIANILELYYPHILGEKTLSGSETYNIHVNDWMPYSLLPQTITESGSFSQYNITYPNQGSLDSFLTMPANEDYVKLNFKYPVDISTVIIEGDNLDSATLYVTGINSSLGFDDQIMHKLGEKSGAACEWTDDTAMRVTSLCIHAETSDGSGGKLTVTISCKEGDARP